MGGMMSIIDNSKVERRYCIHPIDYVIEPRKLGQITREYQEHSIKLGKAAATDCLKNAGMIATDVDMIITVSCTGVIIPSLDAHLINEMGFRDDVVRLPITELGCAAGAAAIARASDYVRAYPGGTVLIVAVELPSLTFQRGNVTQANLISTILFGDGASAAIVTGRPSSGPRLMGSRTYLFPDSIDAMGFDLQETGFHIILSKDVPDLIGGKIKGLVDKFLDKFNLNTKQLSAFVLHPGGQKLLLNIEKELGIEREMTQCSWDVLRDCGNLSSASVLFVLHEWLTKRNIPSGDFGLLAAFGPGFSAELSLLQWA